MVTEGFRFFFLSTVRSRKHRFGLPGAAPAARRSSELYACKVTANSAERYLKGRIQSSQPGSAPSRLSSRGQEPPSPQPKRLHYHSSPFVSLHASSKSHSPHAAQNHVLLYRAEGFAGKAGQQVGRVAPGCPAESVLHLKTAREPGTPPPPPQLLTSRNADNKETSVCLQGSGTQRGAQRLPQLCVCKQPS